MRKSLLIMIAVIVLLIGSSCSGTATETDQDKSSALLVPNVIGMELEDAKSAIKGRGLEVGNIEYIEGDDSGKKVITSQDPQPGEETSKGEQISLTVSIATN